MTVLRQGARGPEVVAIKRRLAELGTWPYKGTPTAVYNLQLVEAVTYFQATHLGPNGLPLAVDGVVGPATRWALDNAQGAPQRSGLNALLIPAGLQTQRTALLQVALAQHNIAERPLGSNRGDSPNGGVDKFLPSWALTTPGPYWCCFFVSWVDHEARGAYRLGRVHGSCSKAWAAAEKLGLAIPRPVQPWHGVMPRPGDAFLVQRAGRIAHIGFVYRVSADGRWFNTVEGNCANRVKVGLRAMDSAIAGWIDMVPEEHGDGWELGLVGAAGTSADAIA